MANIFKCKMCGADLSVMKSATICKCEYGGTVQTTPAFDNEKKTNLVNHANRPRYSNEFDEYASVFESITAEFPRRVRGLLGALLVQVQH